MYTYFSQNLDDIFEFAFLLNDLVHKWQFKKFKNSLEKLKILEFEFIIYFLIKCSKQTKLDCKRLYFTFFFFMYLARD